MNSDQELVGKDFKEASQTHILRARIIDNVPQMGTCEYNPARINVVVKNGKIESIVGRG